MDVKEQVEATFAEVLGVSVEELDLEVPLAELGASLLVMTALIGVEAQLQVQFQDTDIYAIGEGTLRDLCMLAAARASETGLCP